MAPYVTDSHQVPASRYCIFRSDHHHDHDDFNFDVTFLALFIIMICIFGTGYYQSPVYCYSYFDVLLFMIVAFLLLLIIVIMFIVMTDSSYQFTGALYGQ